MDDGSALGGKVFALVVGALPPESDRDAVTRETNLRRDLGLDSLGMASFLFRCGEGLGIDPDELIELYAPAPVHTIGDLVARITARRRERSSVAAPPEAPRLEGLAEAPPRAPDVSTSRADRSPSVVALRREGTKPPLFLARPAVRSSGALVYAPLVRQLDPARPVYALVNRPLADGTPPYAGVEAMAAEYVAAMREIQPRGPYLVGGWCLGGKTAFEMALQLAAQRERVSHLVLLDPAPPVGLAARLRFFGKYALTRLQLRLAGRVRGTDRLLRWAHPIRRWSAMRRFGGLAYYDPDNHEVATLQHLFPGLLDGAALRAMAPTARWEHVHAAVRAADPTSPDEGADVARVRRGYAVLARDHAMNALYVPRARFAGEATMLVVRGDVSVKEQWLPHLARPPRLFELDVTATPEAPSLHEALMAEETAAALAAALNGVLG